MELLASGRTAEVFVWAPDRVLKLDRPDWNGLSRFEADVLGLVVGAGVRAPRAYEVVSIDGRDGVVLERIDGVMLAEVLRAAGPDEIESRAREFVDLHAALNTRVVPGLPDLVTNLAGAIRASGLDAALVAELGALLVAIDDGARGLCHFDLHPGNVIIGPRGPVVIDWLTASSGPPVADFARTLLLDPPDALTARGRFMSVVARMGLATRGIEPQRLGEWIRVVAAARRSEGFTGSAAETLGAFASGARTVDLDA